MLPPLPKTLGNLNQVLPALIESVQGKSNKLNLPTASGAVCLLIDGLGLNNLMASSAHARFMTRNLSPTKLLSTLPSTTATALTTLATGLAPNSHQIFGYSYFDRLQKQEFSYLNSFVNYQDSEHLASYPQLADHTQFFFVAPRKYENSGFTGLTFRNATYVAIDDLADRFEAASKLAAGSIVYLYVPELDQIGHKYGWQSQTWVSKLEDLDSLATKISDSLTKRGSGLVITSDHGMVDVPAENQIELAEYFPTAIAVTSDPRARFLYFERPEQAEAARDLSNELKVFGEIVLVSQVLSNVNPRQPDLVLFAKGKFAFYDRRFSSAKSRLMVGQHGSFSDDELKVPLVLGGSYSI